MEKINAIRSCYDRLDPEASPWEIYTGEETADIVREAGISEEKWIRDATAMMMTQDALRTGKFSSPEERDAYIRKLIGTEIELMLEQYDEQVHTEILVAAIACLDPAQCPINGELQELKEKFISLTMQHGKSNLLSQIIAQCRKLIGEHPEDTPAQPMKNAAATCVAIYANEFSDYPEVAAPVSYLATTSDTDETTDILVYALLATSGTVTAITVLTVVSTLHATVLTELGSLAGMGAAIAADLAFLSTGVAIALGAAMGIAALAGLIKAVASLHEDAPRYVESATTNTETNKGTVTA